MSYGLSKGRKRLLNPFNKIATDKESKLLREHTTMLFACSVLLTIMHGVEDTDENIDAMYFTATSGRNIYDRSASTHMDRS